MDTILLDQPFPLQGSGLPRSSDVPHLTSLIVGYLRSTGQKTFDVERTSAQELGMEMGFVCEEVFSKALGERMVGEATGADQGRDRVLAGLCGRGR